MLRPSSRTAARRPVLSSSLSTMRTTSLFVVGLLAVPASAQFNNIVPTSANGVAGSTVNAFPWGTTAAGWPGLRIMCVYDSSHFTAAPVPINTPILITNVRWRANDQAGSWTGGTFSNASLSLGTAPIDYTAASTVWANNIGPDYTQVYSGTVTVLPGTGNGVGVPGPMVVDIQLTTPFLYDPAAGDLIVDTDFVVGSWTGGSQSGMDVMTTGVLASRVYSSSLYPNANGVDAAAPVIEIGYTFGSGTPATNTTLGQGCVRAFASFYENFATSAAFDLSNSGFTMLPAGNGYIVLQALTTYVTPSGAAAVLALTDDSETQVTLSSPFTYPGGSTGALTVCSNGYVSVAAGNGTGFTPSSATMLNAPQTGWWNWHDYNPAAGGQVKFEQSGGIAYVTFEGVQDFGGSGPATANTFQFQFDTGTGAVHVLFQTMSAGGNGRLVGYSPGGNSSDPGSMDLSAALTGTFNVQAPDVLPLTLAGATRPVLNSSWNLNVTNVPAAGTIGVDIFGLSDPGVVDLGFLGAPGCGARASLDVLNAWIVTGATHGYSLSIPNNPALVNFHVFTQSAVFQPGVNTLLGGVITSNGIDGKIGDL
jgi:hypothetical protein